MEGYLLAVSDLSITLREDICAKTNLFVQIEKIFQNFANLIDSK